MTVDRILVVRLGAMGDIVHALPAAASLKNSFPEARLSWIVARKWLPLLEGNPHLDEVVPFDRSSASQLWQSYQRIRQLRPCLAFDFQGLIQSAAVAKAARPKVLWGFDGRVARESLAAVFYSRTAAPKGPHRVMRNLQLIERSGASKLTDQASLPGGKPEGALPTAPYVLASPFAGWAGKQWPIEHYKHLARLLSHEGLPLVLNVPKSQEHQIAASANIIAHSSSIAGLIWSTRQATAVVGVDSGPLHIAAALGKPGVAVYGPTDPAITGPYGGSINVLRTGEAHTTYERFREIQPSMHAVKPEQVLAALMRSLRSSRTA